MSKLGLSENDKMQHPYFLDKKSRELMKNEELRTAVHLHQATLDMVIYTYLKLNAKLLEAEPTVSFIIEATNGIYNQLTETIEKTLPRIAEKMCKRFGLIEKESESEKRRHEFMEEILKGAIQAKVLEE